MLFLAFQTLKLGGHVCVLRGRRTTFLPRNCKTDMHKVLRLPPENDTVTLTGFQSIAPATLTRNHHGNARHKTAQNNAIWVENQLQQMILLHFAIQVTEKLGRHGLSPTHTRAITGYLDLNFICIYQLHVSEKTHKQRLFEESFQQT